MAKGILIAAMNFRDVAEDEFHDWYDLEHVPERLRVPGFLNAERWISADDPQVSVATYDLDDVGVLNSAPYLAVAHDRSSPWTKRVMGKCERLLRFEGEQIVPGDRVAPEGAAGLLLVAMNVAAEHEADFNDWYNAEHVPALAAVPGTLCARRYRGSGGGAALRGSLSPDRAGGGELGGMEGGCGYTLDRAVAAAFPRFSAGPVPAVCRALKE